MPGVENILPLSVLAQQKGVSQATISKALRRGELRGYMSGKRYVGVYRDALCKHWQPKGGRHGKK